MHSYIWCAAYIRKSLHCVHSTGRVRVRNLLNLPNDVSGGNAVVCGFCALVYVHRR